MTYKKNRWFKIFVTIFCLNIFYLTIHSYIFKMFFFLISFVSNSEYQR